MRTARERSFHSYRGADTHKYRLLLNRVARKSFAREINDW